MGYPSRRPPPKSRAVYILLALVVGLLGVHDFYAGRLIFGLLHLSFTAVNSFLLVVTFGTWACVAVPLTAAQAAWVLVEVVTVTADGRGRYMT